MADAWTFMPLRGHDGSVRAWTLLDCADYERFGHRPYSLQFRGYAGRSYTISVGQRGVIALHREILGLEPGDPREVDHINRDILDNRRCNLRIVTHAEQQQNLTPRRGCTSRFRGVSWDKARQKWFAKAQLNGQQFPLGRFDSEDEAAAVVAEWRATHMTHSEEALA